MILYGLKLLGRSPVWWGRTCSRYIIQLYCPVVDAGIYSDVVQCLPVDPATRIDSRVGQVRIFCAKTVSICIV